MAKRVKLFNQFQLAFLFRCSVDEIKRRVKRERLPYVKRANGVLYFSLRKAIDWLVRWYQQRIKLEEAKVNRLSLKAIPRARTKQQRIAREQPTMWSMPKTPPAIWILSKVLSSDDAESLGRIFQVDGSAASSSINMNASPRSIKNNKGKAPLNDSISRRRTHL